MTWMWPRPFRVLEIKNRLVVRVFLIHMKKPLISSAPDPSDCFRLFQPVAFVALYCHIVRNPQTDKLMNPLAPTITTAL